MTDDSLTRVRAARRELAHHGPPWTRERELDFATVAVSERDGDVLRDLLVAERAGTVVEIGLAYASSALAIGEALLAAGAPRPRHVIVDPLQDSVWKDVGWDLLRSAGLDRVARLIRAPSSLALPGLLAEGFVADAAFVDGSHRFHEVFVDLSFLRRLVRPGGLVVLDDTWAAPVRTAVRYFERNLGWVPVPDAFAAGTRRPADDSGEPVPHCAAYRLPDVPVEPPFQDFQPF